MANKIKDLSGQRFGKLLVLSFNGKNSQGNYRFKCQCDCGNIITVNSGNLQKSKRNSCGCYKWNLIDPDRQYKTCSKCKSKKNIEEFPPNKSRKDGRQQYCAICYPSIRKKYSGKYKIRFAAYMKNKREINVNFRIMDNLRRRINKALHNNKKSDHSIDLLGCNIINFKKHLENKFDNNMTWDNYGKYWCIDHIRPCASFNLSDYTQQKECFNYNNLQPLLIKENQIKSSKYNGKRHTYK